MKNLIIFKEYLRSWSLSSGLHSDWKVSTRSILLEFELVDI